MSLNIPCLSIEAKKIIFLWKLCNLLEFLTFRVKLLTLSQLTQILDLSHTLFMQLGIKSVSMDDLSSRLGISKKTLYQHVSNKHDLVRQSIERHTDLEKQALAEITRTATDAIDEMAQIAEHTVIHFRQIKPVLIHDMQKYYRDIWDTIVRLQSVFIKSKIEDNIKRGKDEDYYREDADPDIISKLYVAKSFSLVDENLFSLTDYPRDYLIRQHILYHLHGILTEKGRKHLYNFQSFKD